MRGGLKSYFDVFGEALEGHLPPFLWLFAIQPTIEIRFDGVVFWSIYAVWTVADAAYLWWFSRTKSRTPICGLVAAMFSFLFFFGIYFGYVNTR